MKKNKRIRIHTLIGCLALALPASRRPTCRTGPLIGEIGANWELLQRT